MTKGVVMDEKCPRDKEPNIMPTKKDKLASDTKKGTALPSGNKKKATLRKVAISATTLREGTSASLVLL